MDEKEREEWEKRHEPVTVPEELKERILSVVDSKDMRGYLAEHDNYSILNWVDLIGGSPRPMDFKLDLLRDLLRVPMNGVARDYLQRCLEEAESAMDRLYHMDPEQSLLLNYNMHSEYIDPFADYAEPCRSYEDFLDHAREDIWEEDDPLEEQSDYQETYYILDLFDVRDGKFRKEITYFCSPNGKVQYYRRNRRSVKPEEWDYDREKLGAPFVGREGLEHWSSPYQVGDVLYVDMRPYFKPTYCLISWIWKEGPGEMQCLYLAPGGVVSHFGFKYGWFLPHLLSSPYDRRRQFYSPLYRAERCTGELPEEYAILKTVGERLKADPELSQRIDNAFTLEGETYCKSELCVYRPVVVKDADWGDEDPDSDVVWHPEREEREWWEDIGRIDGMTKEQLLALVRCGEPEDGSEGEKKNEE